MPSVSSKLIQGVFEPNTQHTVDTVDPYNSRATFLATKIQEQV